MFYTIQMQWINAIQGALRSPWMDTFFKIWDKVDSLYFTVFAITLIWYLWDRKIGIRLFYILILSHLINTFFKYAFYQPRPCHIDPAVGILCLSTPGLPSGAAQLAAIYCGVVFIECRKAICRGLIVVFALFLCFSRVYLGLHFSTDILGGLLVGGFLVWVYKRVFVYFEKNGPVAAVVFSFLLLLLQQLSPSFPSSTSLLSFFYLTLGVAIGLNMYERKGITQPRRFIHRLIAFFIVAAGLSCLIIASHFFYELRHLWYFCEGFWLSFLGGLFYLKCTALLSHR